MTLEDELRLGADAYLAKLAAHQTLIDRMWTGIKIASVAMAMASIWLAIETNRSWKVWNAQLLCIRSLEPSTFGKN